MGRGIKVVVLSPKSPPGDKRSKISIFILTRGETDHVSNHLQRSKIHDTIKALKIVLEDIDFLWGDVEWKPYRLVLSSGSDGTSIMLYVRSRDGDISTIDVFKRGENTLSIELLNYISIIAGAYGYGEAYIEWQDYVDVVKALWNIVVRQYMDRMISGLSI